MRTSSLFLWLCTFCILLYMGCGEKRQTRSIIYPPFSTMGIFAALAIPLGLPLNDAFFSYNFEGVYYDPRNVSELEDMLFYIPITNERKIRSLSRKITYTIFENQLSRLGYPGKSCLLRAICEISLIPITGNGILGDIAHIIFTPSTSQDENLSNAYYKAEKNGNLKLCDQYTEKCPLGFLDDISVTL